MGKLIGGLIGFIFLGPLGAVIGAAAGHFFIDGRGPRREPGSENSGFGRFRASSFFGGMFGYGGFGAGESMYQQVQDLYFQLLFSMMGKMAKADGTVSKAEGDFLIKVLSRMNLTGDARARAVVYFNEAKNSGALITDMAQQFAQLCGRQPQLMRQILYQLVGIAAADGTINAREEQIIRQVAAIFGVSGEEISHIFNAAESTPLNSDAAYDVLGVSKNEDTAAVRAAYRKLIKEYHPDVLRSKGLPKEMMEEAGKRFLKIQQAWDTVKKQRDISA